MRVVIRLGFGENIGVGTVFLEALKSSGPTRYAGPGDNT